MVRHNRREFLEAYRCEWRAGDGRPFWHEGLRPSVGG